MGRNNSDFLFVTYRVGDEIYRTKFHIVTPPTFGLYIKKLREFERASVLYKSKEEGILLFEIKPQGFIKMFLKRGCDESSVKKAIGIFLEYEKGELVEYSTRKLY